MSLILQDLINILASVWIIMAGFKFRNIKKEHDKVLYRLWQLEYNTTLSDGDSHTAKEKHDNGNSNL